MYITGDKKKTTKLTTAIFSIETHNAIVQAYLEHCISLPKVWAQAFSDLLVYNDNDIDILKFLLLHLTGFPNVSK